MVFNRDFGCKKLRVIFPDLFAGTIETLNTFKFRLHPYSVIKNGWFHILKNKPCQNLVFLNFSIAQHILNMHISPILFSPLIQLTHF